MNEESKLNKLILKGAYAVIIVLIIAVIALLILKYEVEGEQNMPFKLSSILILSNAEGYQEKESKDYKWDTEIFQINDIYLNIEKNKNYKETEIIKSIEIENIKINEVPKIGEIKFYRSASNDNNLFNYKEDYKINEKIEYVGDVKSDLSNLKISNQGGTIILRAVNKTGKEYNKRIRKEERLAMHFIRTFQKRNLLLVLFVVTMGSDTDKAMKSLEKLLSENPAWMQLEAIKENRLYVMDRTLFNIKPNAKWAKSYEKIKEILLDK